MKKKIFMYKTKHAETRQQQRGIKNETVDLLLQYGKKHIRTMERQFCVYQEKCGKN